MLKKIEWARRRSDEVLQLYVARNPIMQAELISLRLRNEPVYTPNHVSGTKNAKRKAAVYVLLRRANGQEKYSPPEREIRP